MLGEQQDFFKRGSVRYLPRKIITGQQHAIHRFLREVKNNHHLDRAFRRSREILAQEFEDCDTLIISYEDILLDEKINHQRFSLYEGVNERVERFAELLKDYDVTIFMTVRNWSTWMASYYYQMVRQGETRSLKEFIRDLENDDINWNKPVVALLKNFGAENVNIITYEALQAEPDYLYQQILKASDRPVYGKTEMPRVNRTYGAGTIHYIRFWNWVFSLRSRSPKIRRFIRHKVYPWLTYWLAYTPQLKLKRDQARFFDSQYEQQLAELSELTDPHPKL